MTAELVCAATDPAWLERRREGITATDIVTIAGLVTWDSPWALYHRKLGLLPEPEQSDRMRLGSWLEDALSEYWQEIHGRWLRSSGLFRSECRLWQLATPDYLVRAKSEGGPEFDATLECKTWDERQGRHEWGPDGSDQMPAKVRAQVLWQMDTLGVGTGHVAVVFLPSGEFRSYTIRHHATHVGNEHANYEAEAGCEICDKISDLRVLGFGFWSRILRREPPDLDGLEVTTDALRYLHPAPADQIEIDMTRADLDLYDKAAADKRDAEAYLKTLQNVVRDAMGDAHEATVGGRVVFRRTIGKRAGYTVTPGETDVLRRIGKDKD